jgi:molybdate transport system substrate-binding protein
MATKPLLADLIEKFEQTSATQVIVESVGGVAALKRVQADEAFDIVCLAANVIDQLIAEGKIVAGSRTDLVKSGVAVAVRTGTPRVDLSSEESVKAAVLAAATVGYSTGPSGVYLAKLFERWGIAEQIKDRTVLAPPGVPVGSFMAKGEVELGFQQLTELMNIDGIDILGPLPDAIQLITVFSAGIATTSTQPDAVRELLAFLVSDDAIAIKRANGMDAA